MIFGRHGEWRRVPALVCTVFLSPGSVPLVAQQPAGVAQPSAAGVEKTDKAKAKSADQLDSLIALIALYPDPLLAQVLAASTYRLEIVQARGGLG